MQLQRQPSNWSCFITAFAMCIDTPVADLIAEVGHDGSEIIWPELREPLNRRAWTLQELYTPCIRRGYAPIWWESKIACQPLPEAKLLIKEFNLEELISKSFGGVVCYGAHGWAWDGRYLFNPAGYVESNMNTKVILQNAATFIQILKVG